MILLRIFGELYIGKIRIIYVFSFYEQNCRIISVCEPLIKYQNQIHNICTVDDTEAVTLVLFYLHLLAVTYEWQDLS